MLQIQRIPQTGPRCGRAHTLSSSSSSSLLQSNPTSTSASASPFSRRFFQSSENVSGSRSRSRKTLSPSATSNLLWPSPAAQDSISSRDVQALERSLNPIPPPPIFVADAATCFMIQAEIQGKLDCVDAGSTWDFFSSWGGNDKKDAKAPVFIMMHDGHHVSLAPSLFKVSAATYALARLSFSKQVSSTSNVRTAITAAK